MHLHIYARVCVVCVCVVCVCVCVCVCMQVQTHDIKSVNEALNALYIEEEDYTKLNTSVYIHI